MALQLIVGASGTGKTEYIYDKMIKASLDNPGKPVYYIIPEQSNMAAEQEIVGHHPNGGTMDISVMSFTRLALLIFEKDNIYTGDILDDYGKSMMLMKVLKKIEPELTFYRKMIGKRGFIDEVKSILSEFYQYQITDEILDHLIEDLSPEKSLYYKIKDIKLIKNSFEEAMGNTYMVAEQLLSLFAENIKDSSKLMGVDIYFDGFTGYTPAQYDVISELIKVCNNMYFAVTMEADEPVKGSSELFLMGKETISNLYRIAEDNMIIILPRVNFFDNLRIQTDGELKYIEKNIFRFPVCEYTRCEKDSDNSIRIIEADDHNEELLCIGRMIQYYVREMGYHYRDIAVITGEMNEDIHIWKQVMERLEIPYFIDANEPLLHNPITEITVMLFDLFEKDFSYESVFALLKTGIINIDRDSVFLLENYILKTGIRGQGVWNKTFWRSAKGFDLEKMETIRKEFISYIDELSKVFSLQRAVASEYIHALYSFMEHCKIEEWLNKLAAEYEKDGKLRQAKVYNGAYEKYIMILEKTVDILGEEIIERNVIRDILLTGISDIKLGIIPSTLDQIIIGDMERTRLHHKKILIMAGVNEGILPVTGKSTGLFTERDRSMLEKENVILAPDSRKDYYIQQFYLYLQLSQAQDLIILSYRKTDEKGNALHVSVFLKWIMRMFPYIQKEKAAVILKELLPVTVNDVVSEFADYISCDDLDDSSFYKVMLNYNKKSLERIVRGYMYFNQPGTLNESIAKKLYLKNIDEQGKSYEMVRNVSQLETYCACEFRFFLQYGMHIEKRDEYKIESNHLGTILHAVMEEYFKGIRDGKIVASDHSLDELMDIVRKITVKKAYEIDDTIFESSYRMKHQLEVIIRIAQRSIINLNRHLEKGDMRPRYFEKYFSSKDNLKYNNIILTKDIMMGLNGIIDRVDIKETDDFIYVKVIDYKSGEKNIDFVKIVEGKQLQLAVYLGVIVEFLKKKYPDKKIIPTGMFYYQLADKIAEGTTDDEAEANRIKKSRLTGLFNDDENCLNYMDQKSGTVIPVSYKKDGSLSSNKYEVTTNELKAITEYTRDKMTEIGKKIICGQIDMLPQKGEHASPCTYCDYKSICRFEAGLGGNTYGIGSRLKYSDAKEIVCNGDKTEDDAEE